MNCRGEQARVILEDRAWGRTFPPHLQLDGDDVRCHRCGRNATLSQGGLERAAQLAAFALMHGHSSHRDDSE